MKTSRNTARLKRISISKAHACDMQECRAAQKRIKRQGRKWALDITELLEGYAEEGDMNSYAFAQEIIRQLRAIWRRA